MSACRLTEVTLLTTGVPEKSSSCVSNGSMIAGPVTTITSSSCSSAVDKNTCSWSAVSSRRAQSSSASSGKQALASDRNRSWQTKKNRPTPPADNERASHDSSGVPIIACSIIGRAYPVLTVSSGTKTTADNPDTLHTPLSSASGAHPRRLPLDIPLVL